MKCPRCSQEITDKDIIDIEYQEDGYVINKITTYQCDCELFFMTSTYYHSMGDEDII